MMLPQNQIALKKREWPQFTVASCFAVRSSLYMHGFLYILPACCGKIVDHTRISKAHHPWISEILSNSKSIFLIKHLV